MKIACLDWACSLSGFEFLGCPRARHVPGRISSIGDLFVMKGGFLKDGMISRHGVFVFSFVFFPPPNPFSCLGILHFL